MARLELAKTNSQNWCNTIMRHLDLKFSSITKGKGVGNAGVKAKRFVFCIKNVFSSFLKRLKVKFNY